jgi:phosphatidylinositol alpha-mannosyltransferase
MKIAYLIDDSLDTNDGVQQYVTTLGRWFEKQGHEIYYLCGETSRTDLNNLHSLSRNIKVKFNKNRLSIPIKVNKSKIIKILKDEKFDIVHVQAPYSPILSGNVLNNLPENTKAVATFHILPYSKIETYSTKLLAKSVRKTNSLISSYISVSEPAKEFCKKYFGVESVVIPNPVDINKFKVSSTNTQSNNSIVFLGRLVERKGPLKLLQAFSLLPESSNLHLTFYGDGPLRPKMKDFIKSNKLSTKVKLAGYINEKDKAKVLSEAKIAIFPSIGGESFGIVLTEAMSAGSGVVLGGNNPGYSSVLDNNKVLFDPKNPKEIATKILQFIDDNELFETTHKSQQQLVKKFDIEKVGPAIYDIYSSIIGK